ncbi:hypothetical protein FA10DRAFT_270223 [Acaromyces ingoldii]|uniref:Uncharacterized protein n=1 Tax=Acaromyces ingoldii TaxID=215250 RepID=A0A316YAR9_9BASI|nr:hypothetical protein FA10DRAFT_270223 [Acaromyces ingoldii]PWN86452.1 hypothetical protein FA10DRAFT_270223 [Acaromyces ingoldii]
MYEQTFGRRPNEECRREMIDGERIDSGDRRPCLDVQLIDKSMQPFCIRWVDKVIEVVAL